MDSIEGYGATAQYSSFQNPNGRSKPFNIISTIKCASRSNFIFFGIFLLFIKMGTKIQRFEYSDFVKYLINSKKIQKKM